MSQLLLVTWDLRTLLGLKDAEIPNRQTALVARELDPCNIDIAALQEPRLEGQGSLQKKLHFLLDTERAGDKGKSRSSICDG